MSSSAALGKCIVLYGHHHHHPFPKRFSLLKAETPRPASPNSSHSLPPRPLAPSAAVTPVLPRGPWPGGGESGGSGRKPDPFGVWLMSSKPSHAVARVRLLFTAEVHAVWCGGTMLIHPSTGGHGVRPAFCCNHAAVNTGGEVPESRFLVS